MGQTSNSRRWCSLEHGRGRTGCDYERGSEAGELVLAHVALGVTAFGFESLMACTSHSCTASGRYTHPAQ